ncbi:A/G-specific adenine glycosylase [Pontiella sulfatireligans]|uniref:Adenine DNA glycosylase n=1 Tax=Pontiella sulfatireligans TaxID=2750658 RepID=A0A6C2UNQ4_9BACT|nr:A/G-specific adenine glycosylase [Pontiella sulfatireligans]VGO20967.1 Adenine DNA glycosylase [Pontiella sulfatireligans]
MNKIKRAVKARLLPWFAANKRSMPWRSNRTPYRVWISELMLQQTRVDQATPYFHRFMKRFPSLKSLAAASQEDVLKMWEGLGYYSRARNLHKAAQIIAADYSGRFPRDPAEILKLPGIGGYTVAAIGSLAFNLDMAVLDGNVIRVLSRLTAYTTDTRTTTAKKELQQLADELLVKGDAGNFNEAMMELGATVCLPKNPQCGECPMSKVCLGHESGRPTDYPVKAPKKKTPHMVVGAAVVTNRKGEVLIAQRREKDMLGGLWEFPGGKQETGETIQQCIVRELKEELGINIETCGFLVTVKHAYSHFTMDLHTYFAKIKSGRPRPLECQNFQWLKISDLRKVPYSKADLNIIAELEKPNGLKKG